MRVATAAAKNKIMMFSKAYCPYCVKAKELFKSLGEPYHAIELDERDDGSTIQAELATMTGQRTVPSVWINGRFIGGCDDTHAKHRSGELARLLKGQA
eukprot:tig00020685_g12944.t1